MPFILSSYVLSGHACLFLGDHEGDPLECGVGWGAMCMLGLSECGEGVTGCDLLGPALGGAYCLGGGVVLA